MKYILIILIIIILSNIALAQDCTTELPSIITQDTVLCNQEYQVEQEITINSNIKLDCSKASLIGTSTITAFLLNNTENSQIINCNLAKFASGFYLTNSNNNVITNNKILDSSIQSIYIKQSNNNQIYNNQINTALTYDKASTNQFCVDEQQNEYLNIIGPGCEKEVKVENIVTRTQRDEILTKIAEATGNDLDYLTENYKQTQDKVKIEKTFGNNILKIKITTDEDMNIDVYEYIPKETLESTDLIKTDAVIIDKDPLMMWSFTNIRSTQLQYELPSIVKAPKTIIIETQKIEITQDDVISDELGDSGIGDDTVGNDDLTGTDIENNEDDKQSEEKGSSTAITIIAILALCIIIIYLVKKKW